MRMTEESRITFTATNAGGARSDQGLGGDEAVIACVSERANLDGQSVIFQPGASTGTGTSKLPFFEYDDENPLKYGTGSLVACRLSRTCLSLDFEGGEEDLAFVRGIDVLLEVDRNQWDQFRNYLAEVFREHENILTIDERDHRTSG